MMDDTPEKMKGKKNVEVEKLSNDDEEKQDNSNKEEGEKEQMMIMLVVRNMAMRSLEMA